MALLKRQRLILLSAISWLFTVTLFPLKALSNQAESAGTQSLNILQAVVLGFVQGMTEFLPISSSAHLKVVPVALGWGDPGVAFTAIIQLGSIVAVIWYFWGDLTQITQRATKAIQQKDYKSHDLRLLMGIILGTVPIVFFGLLIKKFIPNYDNSPLRSLIAIAIASIAMSLLLGLAETIGKRQRDFKYLTMKDGLLMGLAESLALIPGVSRSGSTITCGLFLNLQRETAARFSFLLGIPAITLAGLVELKDFLAVGVTNVAVTPMIVGVISSGVFSYIAIACLIQFLKTQSTWVFIWYRLIFGLAILGGIVAGFLKNS